MSCKPRQPQWLTSTNLKTPPHRNPTKTCGHSTRGRPTTVDLKSVHAAVLFFSSVYCCLVFRVNKLHLLEKHLVHFEENMAVTMVHYGPFPSSPCCESVYREHEFRTLMTRLPVTRIWSHTLKHSWNLTTSLCIMVPCWNTLVYKSALLWNVFYFPSFIYMQIWIFSSHFSNFHSSEIILICWFAVQETFLMFINVENSCLIFLWKLWCICVMILWWIEP